MTKNHRGQYTKKALAASNNIYAQIKAIFIKYEKQFNPDDIYALINENAYTERCVQWIMRRTKNEKLRKKS